VTPYRVIDADGHVEPSLMVDWSKYMPLHGHAFASAVRENYKGFFPQGQEQRRGAWDGRARLDDMDSIGIDTVVLFGGAVGLRTDRAGFFSKETVDYPAEIARGYNNWLADYCGADPDRLKGVALVPFGDMEEAVRELRRAVTELGFVGLLQRCAYKDLSPDNPYFDEVYGEAESLNVPVLVHIGNDALQHFFRDHFRYNYIRWHGVGNPVAQMLAVSDMLYGGILEKFPKLRIGFFEGEAGWLPWLLNRLDERYAMRPEEAPLLRKKPSEYVEPGRFFISCESEEPSIPFVAEALGDELLLYNSDYPHVEESYPRSITAIYDNPRLTDRQKRKILSENARALLYGGGAGPA
jgi:predicted TIM-barrel fold metal-dependent hydrolase